MRDIKKKILAITLICAMSVSMAACNDSNNGIVTETISSEEAEQLIRYEFSFDDFNESEDGLEQDPIEGVELNIDNYKGEDKPAGDNNNSADNNNSNSADGNNNNAANDNNGGSADGNNNNAGNNNNNSAGNSNGSANNNNNSGSGSNNGAGNGNNNSSANNNNNNSAGNSNNNSADENNNNSSADDGTIKGTEAKKQSFWMDLTGNFKFDGEFIVAKFKIKETTPNGTYPIVISKIDFANIDATTVEATGINGSVVVGGNAVDTQFKNDGSFEVKADSVSGNPGDTVTVMFKFNNNPGICASVFRFSYDSDALECISGEQGADFLNAIKTQNK